MLTILFQKLFDLSIDLTNLEVSYGTVDNDIFEAYKNRFI